MAQHRFGTTAGVVVVALIACGVAGSTLWTDQRVAAAAWPGHEVLNLSDWTLAKNDQWVASVIDRKLPVYVASTTTWSNVWSATRGGMTVFGRELRQFLDAGYTFDNDWSMSPPGG